VRWCEESPSGWSRLRIVQFPINFVLIRRSPILRSHPATFMALAATVLAMVVAGCGGASDEVGGSDTPQASSGGGESVKLSLVGYSVAKQAYDEIIPAFNATEAGKGISFSQSYGASGDQSRKVESGLEADIVHFSLEPDITRLVKSGQVEE